MDKKYNRKTKKEFLRKEEQAGIWMAMGWLWAMGGHWILLPHKETMKNRRTKEKN